MNYHELVQSTEKKVIPQEMMSIYTDIMLCMERIRTNYSEIKLSDMSSLNSYRERTKSDDKRNEAISQLRSLVKIEKDLLDREAKLENKLISGEILTYEEYELLSTLKEKRDKISKNKDSILKGVHYSNNSIRKNDEKRVNSETQIEIARKAIRDDIEHLNQLINKLKVKKLDLDRLEGLSIEDRHIIELNSVINNYCAEEKLVSSSIDSIDKLFKNSLEIRINMFKDIYLEANSLVANYKKHEDFDFTKINELSALFGTRVWEYPYSIYPYPDMDSKNANERHLTEYADIVEQINLSCRGELSEEELNALKNRIYQENLKTDMFHNNLSYKQADLSKYISYVIERAKEKEVAHTL